MLKALRLQHLTAPLEPCFGAAPVAIARIAFAALLVFHVTACGFHWTAMLSGEEESWLAHEGLADARVATRCDIDHGSTPALRGGLGGLGVDVNSGGCEESLPDCATLPLP
jgi:hypothetical protein